MTTSLHPMRIVTWNVHGAPRDSPLWKVLLELQPDIALLQEIRSIPSSVLDRFDHLTRQAVTKTGRPQRFQTGILVRGKIVAEIRLSSDRDWVNRELEFFSGNFVGCTAQLDDQRSFNTISVHSPAWPVDRDRLRGSDVSWIKSSIENPDVWGTDILWDALRNAVVTDAEWVVGGDLNTSETFDGDWQDRNGRRFGSRSFGNTETLERMRQLGFTECLRRRKEDPIIPTFKHSRGGIYHQLDHLFVCNELASKLEKCSAGDQSIIFGTSLSDHLPIIADFWVQSPLDEYFVYGASGQFLTEDAQGAR